MNYDQNWARWIKASIVKYLIDTDSGTHFIFVEGQERKTNQYNEYLELRFDGPLAREQTKGFWRLDVKTQILCTCNVDADLYHINRLIGYAQHLFFNTSIGVFKLGNGVDDDPAISIGCMTMIPVVGKDNVEAHEYGQINAKIKLLQATVEARYFIEFGP